LKKLLTIGLLFSTLFAHGQLPQLKISANKRFFQSSKSYFDRVPEQSLIADNGKKYNRVLATRGKQYAMFYSYNGRAFTVAIDKLDFTPQKASWFNPRDGDRTTIKDFNNKPNKNI